MTANSPTSASRSITAPRRLSSRSSAWLASLGVHVLLALLLAASVWGITRSRPAPPLPAPVVSFANPSDAAELGAPPGPAAPATPTGAPRPNASAGVTSYLLADVPNPTPSRAPGVPVLRSLTDPAPPEREATAVPDESSPRAAGTPATIAAAPPELRAVAPRSVRFAGLGSSNARRVVYVVDASGPMVTSLPNVIQEIERSVSRLSESQHFGVVLFRDRGESHGSLTDSFMPVLVRATPGSRRRLASWFEQVQPAGKSNPIDGLRAAFALRPDAIFLLSRSIERSGGGVWHLGRAQTLAELDRLNPIDPRTRTRAVAIKTIQFLDDDPTGTMQAIGEAHGAATPLAPDVPADDQRAREPAYTVIRRQEDLKREP